ncbi:acyltransferase family protein [Vibrio cyclitrophicus]
MLGSFRFILAIFVVTQHLLLIPYMGHFAVHGFFILSGFLMTLVMKNTYGYTTGGIKKFLVNRLLRLYPIYWASIIITCLIVIFVSESYSVRYREYIYLPKDVYSWLQNISMIYLNLFPGQVYPRLSPATWALTVELVFYLFIALGVSRNKKITIIWFLISVIYTLSTLFIGLGYEYRYNIIFAGSLPFSIGALIYHFYQELVRIAEKVRVSILYVLLFTNLFLVLIFKLYHFPRVFESLTFIINYAICSLLVLRLYFESNNLSIKKQKIDKVLGDLSYPIYLSHWVIGLLISYLLYAEPKIDRSFDSLFIYLITISVSILFGLLCRYFIDMPIDKLRQRLKTKDKKKNSILSIER